MARSTLRLDAENLMLNTKTSAIVLTARKASQAALLLRDNLGKLSLFDYVGCSSSQTEELSLSAHQISSQSPCEVKTIVILSLYNVAQSNQSLARLKIVHFIPPQVELSWAHEVYSRPNDDARAEKEQLHCRIAPSTKRFQGRSSRARKGIPGGTQGASEARTKT